MEQRESQARFWLGITPTTPLPLPTELKRILLFILESVVEEAKARAESGILHLVAGGPSTEFYDLTCYADYIPSEYLVGSGPAKVTVLYSMNQNGISYNLYKKDHETGGWDDHDSELMTQENYQLTEIDQPLADAQTELRNQVNGRKSVLLLAPAGAQRNISIEAWEATAQWDIQEQDGELLAVRYGIYEEHPEHTQTLQTLKNRISNAAATDAHANTRIANVSDLTQYYRDIGAYDDIPPDDGSDDTFMPAMPPPPFSCDGTTAVGTDPDQGLVEDCNALLSMRDTLAGTATLNWSKTLAMSS